ncbi:MAG: hypothetical protein E7612_06595 [Ruminococcaceae bacterium]|nr:hypothetical protein [Oscillospiraceae bacterium]
MANLKVRDKPKKKSSKRIVTIFVAMVCLLSIGLLSSLSAFSFTSSVSGSGGGQSSQSPGTVPGGSDISNLRGPNDIEIVNQLDFSKFYEYNPDGVKVVSNGYCIDERLEYGYVNTSNETLDFRPKTEDIGKTVGAAFSLYFSNNSTSLNPKSLSSYDYVTFDFDICSDTGIMPDIDFIPRGYRGSELIFDTWFRLRYDSTTNSYGVAVFNGNTGEYVDFVTYFSVEELKESVHLSLVVRPICITSFVEGELIFSSLRSYFDSLFDLNIVVLDHEIKENEAICIDNVCVAAYGNGSGNYDGDLTKLTVNGTEYDEGDTFASIYDCSDWVLYDNFEADRTVMNLKNKEMYTPSSAKVLNKLNFSQYKTDVYDTLRYQNGLRLESGYDGVLSVSTLDDYLKIYSDKSTSSGFSVGFYMLNAASVGNSMSNESKLLLSNYDYVTVDFDVWTDSEFFESMKFQFVGYNSSGTRVVAEEPQFYLNSDYGSDIPYKDSKIPFHITFVIETPADSSNVSRVMMYVNGKYFNSTSYGLGNITYLYYLNLWFSRESITADCSVCFDNLQINGFGNGNGSYTGSISELFASGGSLLELQAIEDSVIYNKTTKSEE